MASALIWRRYVKSECGGEGKKVKGTLRLRSFFLSGIQWKQNMKMNGQFKPTVSAREVVMFKGT